MSAEEEKYKELLGQRLSPYRLNHSLCVAKSASELARRYGADEKKARLAGLLHDITKEADMAEHFVLLKKAGTELSELEQSNPKLWHAMSGAAYLKTQLNINDDEVLCAVRYHTTGRERMSLLEKVIYVADFISEDRDYEDVQIVRDLAEADLDKTMLYTQSYSIRELTKKGRSIHPDSVACYNALILGGIEL